MSPGASTIEIMRIGINKVLAPAILAASLVAFTAAGCSKSDQPAANLPDAASLLSQSAATTKTQTSTHLVLKATGNKPVIKIQQLTGDLTTVPAVAAKGQVKAMGLDLTFVVIDGELWTQIGNAWTDAGPADQYYDVGTVLDPNKGVANLLSNFKDGKSQKLETIDGVESVLITGTLTKEALNTFAGSKLETDIPARAWIQKDGTHEVTKMSVDTSDGNVIDLSMSDWGKPVTVDKPAS